MTKHRTVGECETDKFAPCIGYAGQRSNMYHDLTMMIRINGIDSGASISRKLSRKVANFSPC